MPQRGAGLLARLLLGGDNGGTLQCEGAVRRAYGVTVTLDLILQVAALLIGSGTLWKVLSLAQWKGQVDERLDGHDEDIKRLELEKIQRLRR